jgi:hypothetical protein
MFSAEYNYVRCAVWGVRLSSIRINAVYGSVRQSVRMCAAVWQGTQQCTWPCAVVRVAVCVSLRLSGSV